MGELGKTLPYPLGGKRRGYRRCYLGDKMCKGRRKKGRKLKEKVRKRDVKGKLKLKGFKYMLKGKDN